jgi:hypothetical protein
MAKLILKKVIVTFVAIGLVACAPLQQAPLVYSSKVSVGVDISGTATEQPGVSINVGYKQIDAAYVPVAVAKPCEEKEAGKRENCTDKIYQLKEIEGKNKVGDSAVPKEALEAAQKRISQFKQISHARDSADTELARARSRLDDVERQLAFWKVEKGAALKAATDKNGIGLSNDDSILLAESDRRSALVAVEKAAVATAEGQKRNADEAFNGANVTGLVEAYGLVGGENSKTDAYSVFGSFDANTKASVEVGGTTAPKGEVGLALGKVFSTGVASQNLTEGLRRYYAGLGAEHAGKGITSCLNTGENYIAEYKKTLNLDDAVDKKKLGAIIDRITETCSKGLDEIEARVASQLKEIKK